MNQDVQGLHHRLLTANGLPRWAQPLTAPARYLWVLYRRMARDKAFLRAAGMAYATLVALVPLLMLLFGALDATGILERNPEAVEALIFGTFLGDIPEVRDFLVPGLLAVDLGTMGLVGIGGLALVAMRLYIQVENAYNDILGFSHDRPLHVRVLAFYAAVTAMPVVVIATFLRTWQFSEEWGVDVLGQVAIGAVQLGILLAAIKGFPAQTVRWRPALLGACTSLVLFDLASMGFREYLVLFAADDPVRVIYGSVGVLPVFLLWLYLAWLMVLVGVEVSAIGLNYASLFDAEYDEEAHDLNGRVAPGVDSALFVASVVAGHYEAGRGPMPLAEIATATSMRPADATELLKALEASALVVRSDAGWMLARPADQIPLGAVVEAWRSRTSPHSTQDGPIARLRADLDAPLQGTLHDALARWQGGEGAPPVVTTPEVNLEPPRVTSQRA